MDKYNKQEELSNLDIDNILDKLLGCRKNCWVVQSDKVSTFLGGNEKRHRACVSISDKCIYCTEKVYVIHNPTGHWSVAVFFSGNSPKIYHYDSLEGTNSELFTNLCSKLVLSKDIPANTKVHMPKTFEQGNHWACGYYVIYHLWLIFAQPKFYYLPITNDQIEKCNPSNDIPKILEYLGEN